MERNLLRGLFVRKLKDYAEDTILESKKTLLERLGINKNLVSQDFIS